MAKVMGVPMAEVFNTLQVFLGSLYVNDFNQFGRTWQVNVQADQDFRQQIEHLKRLKIRNNRGLMVPFSALATVRDVTGPVLDRAVTTCIPRRRSTAGPRRAFQLRHRDRAAGTDRQRRISTLVDAPRMDGTRGNTQLQITLKHGHARAGAGRHPRYSWCWPTRSMKAGRCRWP